MRAKLPDIFGEAKEAYTVLDAWLLLGLDGEPRLGMNRSPFREDRSPSFSIFDGGRAWKDHATGDAGDVASFIACAITGSCKAGTETKDWLLERLGIDHGEQPVRRPKALPQRVEEWPGIEWPAELVTGSTKTWDAFAKMRSFAYPTVLVLVEAGLLRFSMVDGHKCFVVLDATERAAEIRRIDGGHWTSGSKAYPLKGVRKVWLPGFEMFDPDHPRDFIITEGATDFMAAFDLVTRYERGGGEFRWLPLACLGASITTLHPEIMDAMPGRNVLLVPDGDEAGRKWRDTLTDKLLCAGAAVDAVQMPEGKDLSDIADQLKPEDLCHAFADNRS